MAANELDLHGRIWSEALKEFIAFYNQSLGRAVNPTGVQLSVIHGYGSTGAGGVVRQRLRSFLERHADRLEFIPGERLDGNQGYTLVKPMKRLPDVDDLLADAILEYCDRPRTRSKIMGKFRSHGQPRIIQAIRSLEKQGRLTAGTAAGPATYVAG